MARIEERSDSFISRLDQSVEDWLKRRLPPLYHFTRWWADRLEQAGDDPRSARIAAVIILLLIVVVYFVGS